MTHAFFKALLFLGAGSVIHALSGEQDLRRMGALWSKIPTTARTFVVAALAIAGIFPLAGFFSKDEILWQTFSGGPTHESELIFKLLWVIGALTAGMTAFYMFRLVNMTFFGQSRVAHDVEHHIHESPRSMTLPLVILAALSVVGGWIGWPASLGGGNPFERFLEPVIVHHEAPAAALPSEAAGHHDPMEYALMIVSLGIAVGGILLARHVYLQRAELADALATRFSTLYRLLYRKYYMDEIYDALFVNRTKDLGSAFAAFDRGIIDGLGVDGTAWVTRVTSSISIWWDTWIVDGAVRLTGALARIASYPVRMVQTGLVQSYALLIVLGVVLFLGYTLLMGIR